jgi:hypothetical protein
MNLNYLTLLWNRFWFKKQSAISIALFRIFYSLVLLESIILFQPDLYDWFGTHAWTTIQTAKLWENSPRFGLFFINTPDNFIVTAIYSVLVISSITLLFGLFTRISALTVFICLTSIHHRNPLILHSGDTLIRLCSYYLIWSQAGKALSLDSLFSKDKADNTSKEKLYNPWAQRLLQIQICAVYWQSFWGKAAGLTWLKGTAVYYALQLEEFQRFPLMFFGTNPIWLYKFLTYYTLFIEFALFSLIWIKEFRYPVIIAGIFLHLGLDYSMNIPLFQHIMIASYLLFIDPKDIKKLFALLKKKPKAVESAT